MSLNIITVPSCHGTCVLWPGISETASSAVHLALSLFASYPALSSSCLPVSCTVLKEAGPSKHNITSCKHPENCQMCFGGFLCPPPPALPLSVPGCVGFNPTQETDSFSQWEPTLAMWMLIRSLLMELGEQRMAPLFFPIFKKSGVVIILLGEGAPHWDTILGIS